MEKKDCFCVTPFTSMLVRADSSISVCCFNNGSARNQKGEIAALYQDSLKEGFQSEFFKELRADMLEGRRHPSCETCWIAEDNGFQSKRETDNQMHAHWVDRIKAGRAPESPIEMSLNLGSLCNLKCRICGPTSSSRWAAEYLELYGEDHIPRTNEMIRNIPAEESRALLVNWPLQAKKFSETMEEWIPRIEAWEFLGGEPFLNKKQFEFTKKSVELKQAQNQFLRFVTNGTIFPEEAAREIWPHFKNLNISVSVDGLERQFEYQRFGADWNTVLQNIRKYQKLESLRFLGILTSVSIFSIYYLPEGFAFWEKEGLPVHLSMVSNPHRFDIRVLPEALKQRVEQKFQQWKAKLSPLHQGNLERILHFMRSGDHSALWKETLISIHNHDRYRGQKFSEVFPEFYREAETLGLWKND